MPDTQERETSEFPFGDAKVELYQPTTGQMLVVLTMLDLEDEDSQQEQVEMVLNFGTVIRKLFVKDEDRRRVHRGLADGRYELEQYMELAHAIVQEWEPDRAGNRAERRAPQKRAAPAKRVSARAKR